MPSSLKMSFAALQLLSLFSTTLAINTRHSNPTSSSSCRTMPGDASWPNSQAWAKLNSTINGRLIATVPLASVCHDPNYDEAACAALAATWSLPQTHYPYPAEIMDPYSQNQSCDPFTPQSQPCELGNYVDYVVNVSSAADAAAGLLFAKNNNIRLVIKSSGHDYLGKSTGRGALSLWTHNLKTIDFFNYTSAGYRGPAVKIGSGVQGYEAYEAAGAAGFRIVGGECSTVALAGGYLQGGGHSALSSTYGMAADQLLEWEVVTANGTHLVASPAQNSDLYWALSGGGGGTYGVVLSATVKAHKDGIVGGAFMEFNTTGISENVFWEGVTALHAALPAIVDSGGSILYALTNNSITLAPVTSPGSSVAQMTTLLKPLTTALKKLGINYQLSITSSPTYLAHFNTYLGPLPYGAPLVNIINVSMAGRIIPRSVVVSEKSNSELTKALKLSVAQEGFLTGGVALKPTHQVAGNTPASNAVLPAWRDAILTVLAFAPWDFNDTLAVNHAANDYLNEVTVPALEAITPGSGTYMNEANPAQNNFQTNFYGSNYARLTAIKNAYDPEHLFYAVTAVGSERWTAGSDGRLCKA